VTLNFTGTQRYEKQTGMEKSILQFLTGPEANFLILLLFDFCIVEAWCSFSASEVYRTRNCIKLLISWEFAASHFRYLCTLMNTLQ